MTNLLLNLNSKITEILLWVIIIGFGIFGSNVGVNNNPLDLPAGVAAIGTGIVGVILGILFCVLFFTPYLILFNMRDHLKAVHDDTSQISNDCKRYLDSIGDGRPPRITTAAQDKRPPRTATAAQDKRPPRTATAAQDETNPDLDRLLHQEIVPALASQGFDAINLDVFIDVLERERDITIEPRDLQKRLRRIGLPFRNQAYQIPDQEQIPDWLDGVWDDPDG